MVYPQRIYFVHSCGMTNIFAHLHVWYPDVARHRFYMVAAPCIGKDKGSFHTHAHSFCTPDTPHGMLLCIPTLRYSDKYYSWPSCIQRVFIPDQTVDETPISCFINQSKRMIRRKPSRPQKTFELSSMFYLPQKIKETP